MSAGHDITVLLTQWANGNQQALAELAPRVYGELRKLAAGYLRRERDGHSLEPTALINEAYVRLLDAEETPACRNRSQFFAIAARLMRQILVDHARRRQSRKREGRRVLLEEAINLPNGRSANLVALDDALKELEEFDVRKARAVEMRYFGGLSLNEIAETLNLSAKTISRDLGLAEAWLCQEMQDGRHP